MLRRWRRHLSPLYLLFPAILIAALVLGVYSYNWSRSISVSGERTIARGIDVVGKKLIDAVEKRIIGGDKILFDLADDDNLRQLPLRNLPQVDAVILLDEGLRVVEGGYVSRARKPEAQAFRRLFEQQILAELHLSELAIGEYKHLHQEFDGRYYLLSFIKKRAPAAPAAAPPGEPPPEPRVRYVVLKLDVSALVGELFSEELTKQSDLLVAVRDEQDRLVFGQQIGTEGGPFLFESVFPTTLYLWRLQVAPRDVVALSAQARRGAVANVVLITVPLGVILFGTFAFMLAARKERIASELKSDFISNVSHDLKTPLSLIRMFGELLATGKVKGPETAHEYATIVWRESERLTRLIDNVLDFARIERGKVAYDFALGDLAEVVERGLDLYRVELERERGPRLRTEIEPGLPPVRLDETAMTLALLNLVDNAVKYAGEGEIAVRLRRRDDLLQLAVADQGPGIPVEEQRRIFDRFYRAKTTRRQPVRGTGIGLSLVRSIAEAHGGRVVVESAPGRGATFTISLPIADEAAELA